jgi:hypothetical protein
MPATAAAAVDRRTSMPRDRHEHQRHRRHHGRQRPHPHRQPPRPAGRPVGAVGRALRRGARPVLSRCCCRWGRAAGSWSGCSRPTIPRRGRARSRPPSPESTAPLKYRHPMAKKDAQRQRRRRAQHRKARKCLHCDARAVGTALCQAHLDEYRARYEALREAGLCTRCGQPSDGGWACPSCRETINERRRAARAQGA